MSAFVSKALGHLGTLLMGVLATLADVGTLTFRVTPMEVALVVVVNAVAGLLVACHVVGAASLEKALARIEADLHLSAATIAASKAAPTAAKTAPATPAVPVAPTAGTSTA